MKMEESGRVLVQRLVHSDLEDHGFKFECEGRKNLMFQFFGTYDQVFSPISLVLSLPNARLFNTVPHIVVTPNHNIYFAAIS